MLRSQETARNSEHVPPGHGIVVFALSPANKPLSPTSPGTAWEALG